MWWLLACTPSVSTSPTDDTAVLDDTAAGDDSAPSDDTAPGDTGAAEDVVLLSLNLHAFKLDGTPYSSNDERFAAIATLAADRGVHVIAVQEACESEAEGVAMDRLAAALAAGSGRTWETAWTETHLAWEGTEDEALEGVGILADSSLEDVETLEYAVQGALVRRTLAATVAGFRIHTVHLEYDDANARRSQARETGVYALVRQDATPILVGDFNATIAEEPLTDLLAAGFRHLGGATIDHVFAPAGADAVSVEEVFATEADAVSDHPGMIVSLRRVEEDAVTTRLIATFDAGFGHYLAVRGGEAPLDWDLGWPAANTASDRWEVAFQAPSEGSLDWKWLRDDADWEVGDDHVTTAGETAETTPVF